MNKGVNHSVRVLRYCEIDVGSIDLIDDAWGFRSQFADVIRLLDMINTTPPDSLLKRLFSRVESEGGSDESSDSC